MARELILTHFVSGSSMGRPKRRRLTFDRVRVASSLVQLSVTCESLTHELLLDVPVFVFVLVSSAQVLIVVEQCRAYRLLRPVLSDHVFIDPFLEVSGIELRNAEVGLVEHGTATCLQRRVIAASEARVEVWRSPGRFERSERRQVATAHAAWRCPTKRPQNLAAQP